jgi:hypothetical protein
VRGTDQDELPAVDVQKLDLIRRIGTLPCRLEEAVLDDW